MSLPKVPRKPSRRQRQGQPSAHAGGAFWLRSPWVGAVGSAMARAATCVLAIGIALFVSSIATPAVPTVSAHATPVKMDPAVHQLVQAPPARVVIQFSETVNGSSASITVRDPTQRRVDNNDTRVDSSNAHVVSVGLPLLKAGTYTVIWRVQSADDGHVSSGSYYFQIAQADGSPPPGPIPTGANGAEGEGGDAEVASLDGPSMVQAIATWVVLVLLAFWVGGLIWETWIVGPSRYSGRPSQTSSSSRSSQPSRLLHRAYDPALEAAHLAAAQRFRRLIPLALGLLVAADVAIALAQAAALAGAWSGAISPSYLRSVLFGSRYGGFWWMRQVVALVALYLAGVTARQGWTADRGEHTERAELPSPELATETATTPVMRRLRTDAQPATRERTAVKEDTLERIADGEGDGRIPDWRREVLATFRNVGRLPGRLVAGWQSRSWLGRMELLLAALLVLAFALSGHAAAAPADRFPAVISVDLLHLLADCAWLGGLFYISLVFIPALGALTTQGKARVLAVGLPEFGAIAIVSAFLLATTGSLNATVRMTALAQLLTTTYGRTLLIKILLFLVMTLISACHAFWLRPRLARALVSESAPKTELGESAEAVIAAVSGSVAGGAASATATPSVAQSRNALQPSAGQDAVHAVQTAEAQRDTATGVPTDTTGIGGMSARLEGWLRREAVIGLGVLLCAALLAAFAGSLATAPAIPNIPPRSAFVATETAGDYAVTLRVAPATFGGNTFLVTLKDKAGKPVTDASILLQTTMLDMEMGTQSLQLQPVSVDAPGLYAGQADLAMGGNWRLVVKVLPPGAKDFQTVVFKLVVGY